MYPHSLCTSLEGTVRPNPTFAKVQKIIFIFERIMRPISNFAKEQKKILLSLKEVWEYNNYHLASWKNCETDQPPSPVLLLTVQSPVTVTVTVSSPPTYCAQEQKLMSLLIEGLPETEKCRHFQSWLKIQKSEPLLYRWVSIRHCIVENMFYFCRTRDVSTKQEGNYK